MSLIAKEDLPAGEKRVYAILKSIGAKTPEVGKREWTYENVLETDLDKDFTEFLPQKKETKTRAAKSKTEASNSKSNNTNNKTTKNNNNDDIIENVIITINDNDDNAYKNDNIETVKNNSREDNDMKAEIRALIKGTSKEESNRIYKGIYFDKDIAHFLDNVQHGNKSEIVNKIMRQFLTENELL